MADLDELVIRVDTDAKEADSGLDSLASTLDDLKAKCKGGAGLASVAKQLKGINSALNGIDTSKLNAVATALGGFSALNGVKLSSSIGTQIGEIGKSVGGLDDSTAARIESIGNAIGGLSGLENIKISSSIGNQLGSIVTAAANIPPDAKEKLSGLADGLAPFASLGKSQLTSFINQLGKLPEIVEKLDDADMDKFAREMRETADAMRPLADEMMKVSTGFSAFPIRIQKIIAGNEGLAASNRRAGKSFGFLRTGINLAAFRALGHELSDCFGQSNKYVEDLNLFTVAMGDAAEEAFEYAQAVKEAIGIDPAEWMRNQGIFKQIASGFGVAADKANLMSKNLTQIGYDISSFYNIPIEESMRKVQSGIAGELDPLRRLGYALDQATLQQIAYDHGITQSFNTMNQAQKSQLRYIAIMQQSKNVMGDMARTALTPANALRILKQEITQLARAVGNILIPFLIQIIPVVQAVVSVLAEAAQFVANLMGFELPTIDYSGLGGGLSDAAGSAGDIEDSIGGAGDAAKELRKTILGIDELNLMADNSQTAGGGTGIYGGGLGDDWDLPLPEYDFLKDVNERTEELQSLAKELLKDILAIGAGFAAWKIAKNVREWFTDLKTGKFKSIKELWDGIDKIALGLGLMVTGFTLEWQGAYDIGYSGINWQNGLKTAIGSALGIGGSLLVFGTGPLGWTIGIGAALTIGVARFAIGYNKRQVEDEIKNRFGEIQLTAAECKAVAEKIMSGPLTIKLDAYVEAETTVQQALDAYAKDMGSVNTMIVRASAGIEIDKDALLNSVDAAISDAQEVLVAGRDKYLLAVSVGIGNENIRAEMSEFASQYFSESQDQLTELGKELRSTIDDALADGVLSGDELETIANFQKEINEIVQRAADAEYKAKLTAMTLDSSGCITYESMKQAMDDAQVIANERMKQLEGMRLENLKFAELKFAEDGNLTAYNAAVADIQRTFLEQKGEIEMGPVVWGLEKFNQSFADVIADNQDAFNRPVSDMINDTLAVLGTEDTGILVDGSIMEFVETIGTSWRNGFDNNIDYTSAPIQGLRETLAALEPSIDQLKKIEEEARAAGEKVPEYVSKGLSDYNQLAALTGNAEAIDYLLGEKLSTDPAFIDALTKAEDAGRWVSDSVASGLSNNLYAVRNSADGTITIIGDTIGERTYAITPTIEQNLNDLGICISDGLLDGAQSEMSSNESEWQKLAKKPNDIFATVNEIHSPSKLFERSGSFLIEGLWGGMKQMWGKLESWWKDLELPQVDFKFPHFEWTTQEATGWVAKTLEAIGLPASIPKLNVSWYASGGFPQMGQLFVANEAGPEMVGTMDGKTAVANNGQIVAGIRAGVRDANEQQNALLREQNALLRKLLEKDTSVTAIVSTDSMADGFERKNRRDGRTTIPVGR